MLVELALAEIASSSPGTGVVLGGSGLPETLRESERLVVSQSLTDVVDKVSWLIARPSLN